MTKAQAGESAVRRAPARSHSWAAVVFALTAAIAFGAIDQYIGALRSSFLTEVSGMSAPWLLLDRKSTRLNSSHLRRSRMPSSA